MMRPHSTSPALLGSWGTNDGGDTKPQGTTCCHRRAGISASRVPGEPSSATSSCEVPWCQLSSFQLLGTRSGDSQHHLLPQADNALRMLERRSHPQTLPARRNAQLKSHHNPVHRACQHPQLSHTRCVQ